MDVPVTGSIVEDADDSGHLFVHVVVSRDPDNRQVPSNRRLNEVRHALTEKGITVEFLLTDSQHQDIEASLRATLLHAFGNDIRNAFMSVDGDIAYVWVEPKRTIDESARETVKAKAKTYLTAFNLELRSLVMTTGENLPSNLACLRAVRHLAPVDAPCLLRELVSRGFTVPSIDWLRRRLDTLRRKGQLIRLESDRYALPLESIRHLGTTRKRTSPDIARLLVLARRGT